MTDIRRVDRWVAASVVLVLLLFVGVRQVRTIRAAAEAAKQQVVVNTNTVAGQKYEAAAQVAAKVAEADDAKAKQMDLTITRLKAQIASLRGVAPNPSANRLSSPSNTDPEPTTSPCSAELTQRLLAAQEAQHLLDLQRIADRDSRIENLAAATESWKAAAAASQIEVTKLRTLASLRDRKWGAGAMYGTSGTAGAYVERAFGPVQVGMSVVRHTVAGGQTTLEAIASAGIRF